MQKRGGIAQLARATGSYPVGHGFKSNSRYQRPVGQAAKTPPFHGGNGSSILPRVTKKEASLKRCFFFAYPIKESNTALAVVRGRLRFCLQNDGVKPSSKLRVERSETNSPTEHPHKIPSLMRCILKDSF